VPVLAVVQNCAVGIDYAALAADQSKCDDCLKLISSSSLQVQQCNIDNSAVWCDLSTGFARPLVPAAWRQRVFAALHNIAHPGIRASRRLVAARYVWPGVAADVAQMCRACQDCGRGKVHSQAAAAVEPIALPARQFSHIHVDLVGPLPASKAGNTYLMTIIDRSTRSFEAVPLAATATTDCAQALFVHWISRYGVPDFVTSDRGPQFASEVWAAVCQ
jgi:Integrase zinc binding domain/Integrase core domain